MTPLFIFYHSKNVSVALWSAAQYLLFILGMFFMKIEKWIIGVSE